jgi:hypothetical protein
MTTFVGLEPRLTLGAGRFTMTSSSLAALVARGLNLEPSLQAIMRASAM